jgi:Rrf2 family transcriptional regulator, cysteine metabolism repressor
MPLKISTRGEYGVRAVLDIAMHSNEGPVTLKSISGRQEISESYLEQLFGTLRKAGLVVSTRGAQGGYDLAREPAQITIGDLIRVLEGPIAPVDCVNDQADKSGGCSNAHRCATRVLWQKLRDSMTEVLDSTTLADLMDTSKELNKEETMYYI